MRGIIIYSDSSREAYALQQIIDVITYNDFISSNEIKTILEDNGIEFEEEY